MARPRSSGGAPGTTDRKYSPNAMAASAIGAANPTVAETQPARNPTRRMVDPRQEIVLAARARKRGGKLGVGEGAGKRRGSADHPEHHHREWRGDRGDLEAEAREHADADHVGDRKRRRRACRHLASIVSAHGRGGGGGGRCHESAEPECAKSLCVRSVFNNATLTILCKRGKNAPGSGSQALSRAESPVLRSVKTFFSALRSSSRQLSISLSGA